MIKSRINMSPAKPYIVSCYSNIMAHFEPKNEGRFVQEEAGGMGENKVSHRWEKLEKANKIPFRLS